MSDKTKQTLVISCWTRHCRVQRLADSLYQLILLFGDFKLNSGIYKWVISDGTVIQKLLNSQNGDEYLGDIFEISSFKWQLEAYPNGWHSEDDGLFQLFVTLLTIPNNWKHFRAFITMKCINTNTQYSTICKFQEDGDWIGWPSIMTSNEFEEQSKSCSFDSPLTFIIEAEIVQITSNNDRILYQIKSENNSNFTEPMHYHWTIDASLMQHMRDKKVISPYKCYESDRFGGNMWYLQLYPNGDVSDREGWVHIYLELKQLPSNVSKLHVQYVITCPNLDIESIEFHDFSYEQYSWSWSQQMLKYEDFVKLNSITFNIKVNVLKVYDLKDNDLSILKWNQFVENENMSEEYKRDFKIEMNEKVQEMQKKMDCMQTEHSDAMDKLNDKYENVANSLADLTETMEIIRSSMDYSNENDKENGNELNENNNEIDDHNDDCNNDFNDDLKEETKETETVTNDDDDDDDSDINNGMKNMMTQYTQLQGKLNQLFEFNGNGHGNQNKTSKMKKKDIDLRNMRLWLEEDVGKIEYFDIFVENELNLELIKCINESDLLSMGIVKLGDRKRILLAIAALNHF